MTKAHNTASFVLRFTQELWQDTQGEPHVRWRGHIRHVQGNEEDRFTDFGKAVTFMQRYLTQLTVDTLAGGGNMSQEKIFRESFKLWEQFATSYADMLSQAMEQSLKQSETFKDRVDDIRQQALKAWWLPDQSNQTEVLEALHALQEQVQALSDRVQVLEEALQGKQETSL